MTAAARNLTPVLLELGGKDPAVVCRDADLDRAARGVVWGAFVNAGQTCASVERVYVEAEVAEAFVAKVVEETARLRVGGVDGDVGPMTMERQRRIVEDHVADAVARGATVRTGGVTPKGPGWFYPPTVLTGVDHTMRVMREETFGPVLPIMAVGVPGGGDPPRQRQRVRADRQRLDARSRGRAPAGRAPVRRRRHHQRLRVQLRRAHRALGRRAAQRDRPHPRGARAARDGGGEVRGRGVPERPEPVVVPLRQRVPPADVGREPIAACARRSAGGCATSSR